MRSRVRALIRAPSTSLSATETVEMETPAAFATSEMPTLPAMPTPAETLHLPKDKQALAPPFWRGKHRLTSPARVAVIMLNVAAANKTAKHRHPFRVGPLLRRAGRMCCTNVSTATLARL